MSDKRKRLALILWNKSMVVLIAANVFQLYAVVVFVVMKFNQLLKLIKNILFMVIPKPLSHRSCCCA
jgi:hypothetical protein